MNTTRVGDIEDLELARDGVENLTIAVNSIRSEVGEDAVPLARAYDAFIKELEWVTEKAGAQIEFRQVDFP